MEVLNGVIEGDISPNHDITIKGILNGTLIVNGVYADVHGVVNGDVIVNNGGSVNITGLCKGVLLITVAWSPLQEWLAEKYQQYMVIQKYCRMP